MLHGVAWYLNTGGGYIRLIDVTAALEAVTGARRIHQVAVAPAETCLSLRGL